MEKTCDYNICTGCGVCSTVCPKNCISFKTGDFGHIYPKIDTSVCIDCKKCERVCPAINDSDYNKPIKAYAGVIKNESDYITTTSGGAAQALSILALRNGGVVYGCASLSKAGIAHIRVTDEEKLELLKGSKYVQSKVCGVYNDIVKDVNAGTEVLFIGTPCQCDAVKSLFKTKPENLCLVELICHGVPSQIFLHDYLKKQGCNLGDIDRLWFRTDCGYQIVASRKSQSGSYTPIYKSIPLWSKGCKDIYYHTFFYGYSYRPSCYTCKYARPERCADITIGDFWGLGAKIPATEIPDHPHGISVVLPCTTKGQKIINQILDIISLYKRPIDEAINGNHQLQHPTAKGVDVKLFSLLRKLIGIKFAFTISFFIRRTLGFFSRKLKG